MGFALGAFLDLFDNEFHFGNVERFVRLRAAVFDCVCHAFDELTGSTTDGKVVGTGVIDGKECTHLAFRAPDVDWQLWVRTGDSPLPCQYVITTKHVAQAPQYAIRFSGWSTDAPAADAFIFTPPSGAKKVSLDELKGIDELPDAADEGDTQ